MKRFTLLIGNKNYSSWSLRPWLAMKTAGIAFEEVLIPLYGTDDYKEKIRSYSPSGLVPCLIDNGLAISDSLAICEYIAEQFPAAKLWPADREARAVARSVSAEMHAGFSNLRNHRYMNIRNSYPNVGYHPGAAEDVKRITELWRSCRNRYGFGGEFLFGAFTIADAMYAPVVTRFKTYGIQADPQCERYMQSVLNLPAMREWIAGARAEKYVIEKYDRVNT